MNSTWLKQIHKNVSASKDAYIAQTPLYKYLLDAELRPLILVRCYLDTLKRVL